jgi:tRNA A37 threonylcarbamoyladenosine synthetase subunit TsaC/SUA5/YrdC
LSMGYQLADAHGNNLDLIVDLGEELPALVTTILDLTHGEIDVIREGAGDLSLL